MMLQKKRTGESPGLKSGFPDVNRAKMGIALKVIVLAVWIFVAPAVPVQAENQTQNADQRPEAGKKVSAGERRKIETLIVTAQKREENVQKVPVSIDVFSESRIEDTGIEDMVDLTQFTPNVYLKNTIPESTMIIRGVTSFHAALYSPGGLYVDDVNFPLQYMHNAELYDIERVEVLKGPQGTLYGRNTESGVVNIVTRQPGNEFGGKISVGYGNYNSYKLSAGISGPIVRDKLFLGLAGQISRSDGFMTNEHTGDDKAAEKDHLNLRGTLRWTPADRWDIAFIADTLDTDDKHNLYRLTSGPGGTDRHRSKKDYPGTHDHQNGHGQTLRIRHEANAFDFLSVSSMRYYDRGLVGDRDMTEQPVGYSDFYWEDQQFSQEFRLSSPRNNGPFQWVAGLYGFTEELDMVSKINYIGTGPYWDNFPGMKVKGYAVFGQGTYTFFNKLHLTAGVRFDHHDLEGRLEGRPSMSSPAGQILEKDQAFNEVLPKVAAAWDFSEDIMGYLSASKGYLIGGYNFSAFSQAAFTYDPEYTWNYEAGFKSTWLNGKLIANAALFYIDISDKQVYEPDPTVSVPGAQSIKNAAKAHTQGAELEIQAKPLRNLDLFAGFGYTEAKIDTWVSNVGGTEYDYGDKDLIYVPGYKYNIGVQYRHPAGLMARADLMTVGDFHTDNKNILKHDAYSMVNLRLGYETEHYDLIVWAKNVFDESYFRYQTPFGSNVLVSDGDPRTFGVTVNYRF